MTSCKCRMSKKIITLSVYLLDFEKRKVRQIQKYSNFNNNFFYDNKKIKSSISSAHQFFDFIFFKKLNFRHFDFGGYFIEEKKNKDSKKKNISSFKGKFGGEVEINYDYISFFSILYELILKIINSKKVQMGILITGSAGFIGNEVALALATRYPKEKFVGVDNLNNYYDTNLKKKDFEG